MAAAVCGVIQHSTTKSNLELIASAEMHTAIDLTNDGGPLWQTSRCPPPKGVSPAPKKAFLRRCSPEGRIACLQQLHGSTPNTWRMTAVELRAKGHRARHGFLRVERSDSVVGMDGMGMGEARSEIGPPPATTCRWGLGSLVAAEVGPGTRREEGSRTCMYRYIVLGRTH